jgi:hypothetical protein
MKGVSLVTRRIKPCAIVFGIFVISFPPQFPAQHANNRTNRGARIRALAEELRWRTEYGRKRYEAEKSELTHNVLSEIDQYITETFVPGSATAEQVQSGLNDLLGYTKGQGIQNIAFPANLPKGDFLIAGIDLWRGGAAINEDYICFRAYADSGGRLVHIASTGNLVASDSFLDDVNARALQPPPIAGEFWFVSWADVPPQSPYTIAIRLYAFNGTKFRTIWAPQNIVAAGIDTAVQVGPSDVFTINRMRTWTSQNIIHEQYTVSANGPKKVKEWITAR